MKPKRIQRRRTKGWRKPEGAVCVTRPGFWGNPYPTAAEFREKLIEAMSADFRPSSEHDFHMLAIAANLDELRGKDLCCWCPPEADCHADVLIEFANRDDK